MPAADPIGATSGFNAWEDAQHPDRRRDVIHERHHDRGALRGHGALNVSVRHTEQRTKVHYREDVGGTNFEGGGPGARE